VSVYVDPLTACVPNASWPWRRSCHLFADTLEELHEFAALINLSRVWFQRHRQCDHYDLTAGRRALAIQMGAISLSRRETVDKWREIRATRPPVEPDGEA
jgi:hypothetical protein